MQNAEDMRLYSRAEGLLGWLIGHCSKQIHDEKQKPEPDMELISYWIQERESLLDEQDRLSPQNSEHSQSVLQRYSQQPQALRNQVP